MASDADPAARSSTRRGAGVPQPVALDDDLANRRVAIGTTMIGILLLAVGLASSSPTPITVGITLLVLSGPLYLLGRVHAGRHSAVAWWPTDGPNPGQRTAIRGSATTVLVRTRGWDAVTNRTDSGPVVLVERRGALAWLHRLRHDRPTLTKLGLAPDGRRRA